MMTKALKCAEWIKEFIGESDSEMFFFFGGFDFSLFSEEQTGLSSASTHITTRRHYILRYYSSIIIQKKTKDVKRKTHHLF